jgi:hypothetical protein
MRRRHEDRGRGWRPVVPIAVCGALLSAGLAYGQSRTDLNGVWKLNTQLSTQPGVASAGEREAAMRRSPVGGSGAPLGGNRGPVSAGSGYTGGKPEEVAQIREGNRLALLTYSTLTISLADRVVTIADESGRTRTLATDNKPVKSKAGALTLETRAKWANPVLVVERKFEGGVKLTERYIVTAAPRRLTIEAKLESPGDRARTFQRVYEPSE